MIFLLSPYDMTIWKWLTIPFTMSHHFLGRHESDNSLHHYMLFEYEYSHVCSYVFNVYMGRNY